MPTLESTSPQRPSDVVLRFEETTPAEVAEAASAARDARTGWAAAPPADRAAALHAAADSVAEAADELTALVVREVGKPLTEARGEVGRSVAILRYYAQQVFDPTGAVHTSSGGGSGLSYSRRRARGVAGLVTPWNFPLAIPVWKAAPALAFGNAVLLKPAPQATACAQRLSRLLEPHVPPGLLAVLAGHGTTGSAVIDAADLVSFTGSAAVGSVVAAAATARGVPVQCEMGGQNPAVVLPDADVEATAAQIAYAAFGYAGQKCTATKRVIIVDDGGGFAERFAEALLAATRSLTMGDPADQATAVGPVIERAARDRVLRAADSAREAGGRVLTGGRAGPADGWFAEPTVVDRLPGDHLLMREEVFGPICAVATAPTTADALDLANGVRYGLTAAVYTRDLDAALRFADSLEAGQIKVNAPTTGVDFHLPFGGEGDSSFGPREQGKAAQDFYTSVRTVIVAPPGRA